MQAGNVYAQDAPRQPIKSSAPRHSPPDMPPATAPGKVSGTLTAAPTLPVVLEDRPASCKASTITSAEWVVARRGM